jgi:hypothetical protein
VGDFGKMFGEVMGALSPHALSPDKSLGKQMVINEF